jgi:hypothetical protein
VDLVYQLLKKAQHLMDTVDFGHYDVIMHGWAEDQQAVSWLNAHGLSHIGRDHNLTPLTNRHRSVKTVFARLANHTSASSLRG